MYKSESKYYNYIYNLKKKRKYLIKLNDDTLKLNQDSYRNYKLSEDIC